MFKNVKTIPQRIKT